MFTKMCSMLCLFCIIQLYLLAPVNGIRVQNLIESKHNLVFGQPLALQGPDIRSEGIFESFLRNLFDLLSKVFPERKIVRYCRTLNRHLRDMDFKYTKALAKHLRYLSRMYGADIKHEVEDYRKELDIRLPIRTQFLEAMNEMFTLREKILFNDYIFDLRDYANEDKLSVDDETHKLLSMIVDRVFKLSERDRKELERKLRKSIKEYQREYLFT